MGEFYPFVSESKVVLSLTRGKIVFQIMGVRSTEQSKGIITFDTFIINVRASCSQNPL